MANHKAFFEKTMDGSKATRYLGYIYIYYLVIFSIAIDNDHVLVDLPMNHGEFPVRKL
jgi:hypothetical protein